MFRNRIPSMHPLRSLALVAAAVAAVACADRAGPTSPASLAADARGKGDSAQCDLVVSGRLVRFTGIDTTSDTTGRFEPVRGGKVELYFLAPLPGDSVPDDSIPRDSIPRDTIPRDSIPRDSVGRDSLGLRGLVLLASRAAGDSVGRPDTTRGPARQPDYKASAGGDGTFSIEGVCPGIYHIVYSAPGANGYSTTNVIVIDRDYRGITAVFPPRRR